MSTTFGQQFEAMMAEAAAKAIQEYLTLGSPPDILAFTRSFFSVPQTQEVSAKPTEKPKEPKEKAKKCSARTVKGKACSKCAKKGEVFCASHLPNRAELEPSDAKTEEEKTVKAKKCCAMTAKGARCSKNAKEGCDKCAIHSKDKVEKKETKKTEAKKKSESRGSVVVLESLVEGEEEEEGEVVSMVKISDMSLEGVDEEEESEDDNSVVIDEEEFDE